MALSTLHLGRSGFWYAKLTCTLHLERSGFWSAKLMQVVGYHCGILEGKKGSHIGILRTKNYCKGTSAVRVGSSRRRLA